MTIPILGEIERLINEHGSSVILKERISLASDQISLIQQQKAIAESQSIALKGEVTNLQEKVTTQPIDILPGRPGSNSGFLC